jgi:hypothetical protein
VNAKTQQRAGGGELLKLQKAAEAMEVLIQARRNELRALKKRESVVMTTLGTLAVRQSECLKTIARLHARKVAVGGV